MPNVAGYEIIFTLDKLHGSVMVGEPDEQKAKSDLELKYATSILSHAAKNPER
jgi:hypothetical protein